MDASGKACPVEEPTTDSIALWSGRAEAMCTSHAVKILQEQKQGPVHTCENAIVTLARAHSRQSILQRYREAGGSSVAQGTCSSRGLIWFSAPCWATHNQ